MEIRQLDPEFTLDARKFAPKVLALFEEAKAASARNEQRIANVASADSADADLMFREGMQAYNSGDLPESLLKIRSALKINSQHRLAAEYLRLIERRLQLNVEQLTLDWHEQFAAGDFAGAFETYRRLRSADLDGVAAASLDQVVNEYRKAITAMARSWAGACAAKDSATMNRIRAESNRVLPDASIASDILDQMNNCAVSPAPAAPPPIAAQPEPEPLLGCLQDEASVAMIRLKSRVDPRIPTQLRNRRSIRVRVAVKIDETGKTRVYKVQGGPMPVTRVVVDAVNQWKFHPATYNNKPACVEAELPVVLTR
jgi:hypothetical protein